MTLLHKLAGLLAHMVGDPVHTQSATAIQTTLKALAQEGTPKTQRALGEKIEELAEIERAITPQEWTELKKVADEHLAADAAEAAKPVEATSETQPPTAPPSAPPAS